MDYKSKGNYQTKTQQHAKATKSHNIVSISHAEQKNPQKGRQPSAINYVGGGVGVLFISLGLLAPPGISFFQDYNILSSSSFKNYRTVVET
jgi:hypothetical protein